MALLTGFLLVAGLGFFHHFGILGVQLLVSRRPHETHRAILKAFFGLLILHTAEIVAFAGVYWLLLDAGWFGTLGGTFSENFGDLIYFSGINFVTLGYTQLTTEGSIRMISMMQSLGGFMVLTWSATFIYSVWQEAVKLRRDQQP